jgi:iron complex outermembrane receptor protein
MEQWSLPVTIAVWLLSSGGGEEPRDANETRQDEERRDEPQEEEGTIVTARKWEEQIEDVPQSVTAVSGEELQDAHATTVRDASLLAPNVYISEFSSRRLSFPFVRGIGSGVGEPAVITYIDGVPQFGTGGTNLPLVDVERVEFLRGPQGTLWGLNALGGLVHVATRRPGARNEIGAGVTLGNHGLQEYDLGWSGPIGRDFGGSIAARYSVRDGYTENDFTGNTLDDRESVFGRTQLVYAPDGESELRLTLFGERARDGGFVLSDLDGLRDDPFHVNQDFEGETERDVISPALTFVHTGEDLELTSITAYQDWRILETSDFDFSPFDAVVRRTSESQRYWVEELRLATLEDSPMRVADDMDLRWQLGVLGFVSDANRSAQNDFRPPRSSGSTASTSAARSRPTRPRYARSSRPPKR